LGDGFRGFSPWLLGPIAVRACGGGDCSLHDEQEVEEEGIEDKV
jgi:hypothetical protein